MKQALIIGIFVVIAVAVFWFVKVPKSIAPTTSVTPVFTNSSTPTSSSPVESGTSGINGYVHLGPTCPVQRDPPDPQCNDKSYAHVTVIATSGSGATYSDTTNDAGNFHIVAPAGMYTVGVPGNSNLPRCVQVQAFVETDRFISIDISCDTGIR